MKQHLQSKTVFGLFAILGLAAGLAFAGKLTPEMVDVIKYIGGSYMAVRCVANYSEGKNGKS